MLLDFLMPLAKSEKDLGFSLFSNDDLRIIDLFYLLVIRFYKMSQTRPHFSFIFVLLAILKATKLTMDFSGIRTLNG